MFYAIYEDSPTITTLKWIRYLEREVILQNRRMFDYDSESSFRVLYPLVRVGRRATLSAWVEKHLNKITEGTPIMISNLMKEDCEWN